LNNKLKDKKEIAITEFQPKLGMVQKINLITKEVAKKQTNPIPSFIGASFAIPLNIKSTFIFIRT
jgi:hypothetical protein